MYVQICIDICIYIYIYISIYEVEALLKEHGIKMIDEVRWTRTYIYIYMYMYIYI